MKELTKRQRRVLEFIQDQQDSAGLVPTYREIAAHFGFNLKNA